MPGLHLISTQRASLDCVNARSSLAPALHEPGYIAEELFATETVWLAATRYPAYPLTVIRSGSRLTAFEGRLYLPDCGRLHSLLAELGRLLLSEDPTDRAGLTHWLTTWDGDYVAVSIDSATGRWALVNDPLGRLPLYLYGADGYTVISREYAWISQQPRETRLDRIALAQQMLFEAPLGGRTLTENIERLPGATLLSSDSNGLQRRSLATLRIDETDSTRTVDEAAEELAEAFVDSAVRQATDTNVVSLSGGLDSRSVAGALARSTGPVFTMTFIDHRGHARTDATLARQIAQTLDLDWRLVKLPAATGNDLDVLLRLKGGANYVAMAFGLNFLRAMREVAGESASMFTGDGGDTILPAIKPPIALRTDSRAARYLAERFYLLPLPRAASLCRVSATDLRESIEQALARYPEPRAEDKAAAFQLRERGFKWLMEGEDRNRCFLWSATPFYTRSFVTKAMAIPDRHKRHGRLYGIFLQRLNPSLADIIDAKRGLAPSDQRYGLKLQLISVLNRHPGLLRLLQRRLRTVASYGSESATIRLLRLQINDSEAVRHYFDRHQFARLISECDRHPREVFDNLLTLTCTAERVLEGQSLLSTMLNETFD